MVRAINSPIKKLAIQYFTIQLLIGVIEGKTMTAKGLQIGNYVQDEQGRIVTVSKLHKSGLDIDRINDDSDDYKPIPLDEEWLGLLGFVKGFASNGIPIYSNSTINIYLHGSRLGLYDGHLDLDDGNCFKPVLEYVHQLQNLHFALTGEELTIKGV